MRSRPSRALAGVLVAALLLVPGAQAGVAFKGFSTKRANALRADLGKSVFPYPAFVDVVVKPGDLPEGSLGLASSDGVIVLDEDAFVSDDVRAFALLHELSHQLDYQVLRNAERGRFYQAAGFGKASEVDGYADKSWYNPGLSHDKIPAEQFASAIPLVAWPASNGNPFVGDDGACLGWEGGEGCAAPLSEVRAIVDALLSQKGLGPLENSEPDAVTPGESFVPLSVAAPQERVLRPPDAGVTPVPTVLSSLTPLTGVSSKRESALRVRLKGSLGVLPGVRVMVDFQDGNSWRQLSELVTDRAGEITYLFRPKGWHPTAFRVTFLGAANLVGNSLVVDVAYAK